MNDKEIMILINKVKIGDQVAVDKLLNEVKDITYNLSIRMLKHTQSAEDASQEILIKVFLNLPKFKGESKFTTWVYKIATNHLLTTKKSLVEQKEITFDYVSKELQAGNKHSNNLSLNDAEKGIFTEEVKVHCTHSMLLCLDRNHRIAFIIGVILDFKSDEGAYILEITPETFRKRVSRARKKISEFMKGNCGLINKNNSCRCRRMVDFAVNKKIINTDKLLYVNEGIENTENKFIKNYVKEVEEIEDVAVIYRSNPVYLLNYNIVNKIKNIISEDKYNIFANI